jgi:hypothetical protein
MLKKSIIGLLLLAIAMPAFAGGDVEKKVEKGDWPVVYKWLEACKHIKVVMNVGYYVKIEQCKEKKIKLAQKSVKEYEGCVEFKIKSNFDLELGATIHPTAAGLAIQSNTGKWSAWISGEHFVAPSTGYQKRTVCAKVKDAAIINADPNKELHVANVWILIKPTATP